MIAGRHVPLLSAGPAGGARACRRVALAALGTIRGYRKSQPCALRGIGGQRTEHEYLDIVGMRAQRQYLHVFSPGNGIVPNGILLALIAYASYSFSDGVIKSLGGQFTVFEIGFFSTLFAGCFLFFTKPNGERWRDVWRTKRPWAVQARALAGIASGVLSVFAFTTI